MNATTIISGTITTIAAAISPTTALIIAITVCVVFASIVTVLAIGAFNHRIATNIAMMVKAWRQPGDP